MSSIALFNGSAAGGELAWSRGLHYGDGVFRTCLIYASHIIDIDMQIEKLAGDARRLGLQIPPTSLIEAEARLLAARDETPGVLKVFVMRADGERGYGPRTPNTDRLLCRSAAPVFPSRFWERGIQASRSGFRLAAQPALAGLKHLNRLEQVLASRDWPDGAAEVILADDAGQPLAGTRTNLFWVSGGVLRTPALDRCGVAGLMRDKVLAAAATLGLRTLIAPGTWPELESAAEAFVTNSLVGIWPLAKLDARSWQAPGPVTRRLMDQLRHPRLVAA